MAAISGLTKTCTHSYITKQQKQLISLIKSCKTKTQFHQIHAYLFTTSLLQNPDIFLHFLSLTISLKFNKDSTFLRRVFGLIKNPSLFEYNTTIRAYSSSDKPIEGVLLYQKMRSRGLKTDSLGLSSVLKCFDRIQSVGGLQIHGRIWRDGYVSDSLLLTDLMGYYSNIAEFSNSYRVFDEIRHRDTISWNVLISCYLRGQRTRDVFSVFDKMVGGALIYCVPDDVTCLLVIQACAELGALEFGEKVHAYIKERGYDYFIKLRNSLIAMYSRCGCIDKAYSVFSNTHDKNIVTWSALILGYAINGHGKEAISAFNEMQRLGISPDDQTFTSVLAACSHCGLVSQGMNLFDSMRIEFGIKPNIQHYGCVIDLLGRAGLLNQAYQVILSMEVKPDSNIWRTLLGACRMHRHATLGEHVIKQLIELKAQEAGDYVLLLNTYASDNDWAKVAELRKFMKNQGIHTTPGCSSIVLKGEVHEFIADDINHPEKEKIYVKLAEINQQVKIYGYIAEITSELHDLDDERKRYALSYHSEKLAIAFGILATPPGRAIRIAKNLRTCSDCHNFAKAVSAVYDRELIIRDRTRFHHFRGGCCSCNDYW